MKKCNVDIISKLRKESQLNSKENRYKVVQYFRTNGSETESFNLETSNVSDICTVFDIELEDKKNKDVTIEAQKEDRYVYDLYYTQSDDLGDAELNDMISVYPLSENLVYGSYRDNGLNESDDTNDSEDSNAENYYTNDYPDEESGAESVTDEYMIKAVKRMNTGEGSDLSSDEDDEKYTYDEDNIDEEDVMRYGKQYAKFKARCNKVLETESEEHAFYDSDDYYD